MCSLKERLEARFYPYDFTIIDNKITVIGEAIYCAHVHYPDGASYEEIEKLVKSRVDYLDALEL